MSRRRTARRIRALPRVLPLVAVIAVLALAVFALGRGLLGLLNAFGHDGGAMEPDPMFAEEAVQVTRPPELDAEGEPPALSDDPSRNWVYEELTPVDKTAGELAAESLDASMPDGTVPAADGSPADETASDAIAN